MCIHIEWLPFSSQLAAYVWLFYFEDTWILLGFFKINSCRHKKVIHFLISIFFLVAALSLIPHYLAKQNVHDINLKMNKEWLLEIQFNMLAPVFFINRYPVRDTVSPTQWRIHDTGSNFDNVAELFHNLDSSCVLV